MQYETGIINLKFCIYTCKNMHTYNFLTGHFHCDTRDICYNFDNTQYKLK